MTCRVKYIGNMGDRVLETDRNNIATLDHDVAHPQLVQFEDISKHRTFLLGDVARMRLVIQCFFNISANGCFLAHEKRAKPLE
ncbi:MAG: hypothetical protein Q8M31_10955 [Beijerinckiaceae bacterium]|nr:hypothetical protein [Beijerinckiaceae bacterium]